MISFSIWERERNSRNRRNKTWRNKCVAVDNDEWSIENTKMVVNNNRNAIDVFSALETVSQNNFDVLRKYSIVLFFDLPLMISKIKPNGIILLSGLLKEA